MPYTQAVLIDKEKGLIVNLANVLTAKINDNPTRKSEPYEIRIAFLGGTDYTLTFSDKTVRDEVFDDIAASMFMPSNKPTVNVSTIESAVKTRREVDKRNAKMFDISKIKPVSEQ